MRKKRIKAKTKVKGEEDPYQDLQSDDEADDEASNSSSEIIYISPTATDGAGPNSSSNFDVPAGPSCPLDSSLVFSRSSRESIEVDDIFIGPIALLSAMMQKHDLLLIDIRRTFDFVETRILVENHLEKGHILNVPGELILPGLSADIFGELLEPEDQKIWFLRQTFEMIVLVDTDTHKYNFAGSKIDQLRNLIMKWDFAERQAYYKKPRILCGGMKEFIEWYPSEVGNTNSFLSKSNSEIDDLLRLDSICYPETGAGHLMNLKLHSINSIGNLETRIQRDFLTTGLEEQTCPRQSLSEGNLPVDYYTSRDNLAGPFKSLSHESLAVECGPAEFEPILPLKPEGEHDVQKETPKIRVVIVKSNAADGPHHLKASDKGKRDGKDKPSGTIRKSRSRNRVPRNVGHEKVSRREYCTLYGEGFCGMTNINNICYMNSILQCMKVLPVFKATYVTSDLYVAITTLRPPNINPQLAQVLREIWGGTTSNPKYFFIEQFKQRICEINPDFNRGDHEDAFEFLIFLLNLISDDCFVDMPRPPVMTESEKAWFGHLQGRSSFLADTFYHQLKTTKICYNCRRTNLSFETDNTLMLCMNEEKCSLQAMVEDYMKDNLVPDYSCSHCKCTATIVNKKEIVVDPEVLVIVLKRHLINPDGSSHKNESPIDFPLKDLRFGKSTYDCSSIVQHAGYTGQGHYFATVLMDAKTNDWLLFDDELIMRQWFAVNESIKVRKLAAGFFYVRR